VPTKNKNIDIDDVAKAAGVSITTVSRVINKVPTVTKINRLKVEEAIRRLGYKPSPFAQTLASGKTNTVALVIPRYEGIFYSFYALELIRGIGTLCDVLKLDLLLHLTDGKTFINTRAVGGVIFADIIGNRAQLEQAVKDDIPIVVMNNLVQDLAVNCIGIDNTKGAREAVDYLVSLGHKRIAHVSGDLITQAASQRLEGYKHALQRHALSIKEEYIIKTDYSRRAARAAAEKLLALKPMPTAIFIASDAMALEIMGVIMERGLKVPDDISLIGFDDNPSSLYGPVALTTVRQPLVKMAQEAVKLLHLLMQGKIKSVKKVSLPTALIIRESCKQIKAKQAKA
jgi:LacI family transcriptional regulator